jgi:hypothetical protein
MNESNPPSDHKPPKTEAELRQKIDSLIARMASLSESIRAQLEQLQHRSNQLLSLMKSEREERKRKRNLSQPRTIVTKPTKIELEVEDAFIQVVNDLAMRTRRSKAEVIRDAMNLYIKAIDEWEKGRGIVFEPIKEETSTEPQSSPSLHNGIMNNHPIQPPTELIEKIVLETIDKFPDDEEFPIKAEEAREEYLATYFAQWGADQELKASCDLLCQHEGSPLCGGVAEWLRDTRRPKSLHQQALDILTRLQAGEAISRNGPELEIIRRALGEKE